jgi:hypothetical protein
MKQKRHPGKGWRFHFEYPFNPLKGEKVITHWTILL